LLDRTLSDPNLNDEGAAASLAADSAAVDAPRPSGLQKLIGWLGRVGQFFLALSFSSLTRRIVSLNLAGLVALVACILYLSQFRAGLIDARAQSLQVSAEIIAGAIAASATVDTNTITIDPDRRGRPAGHCRPGAETEGRNHQDDRGSLSGVARPALID